MRQIKSRNIKKIVNAGFQIIIILSLCLIFSPSESLAVFDARAHWPVEVTDGFNPVYGRVLMKESGGGLVEFLEDGDSIGMFDLENNCYGAGLFDGNKNIFSLSAFKMDKGDKTFDDYSIAGFEDGDEVVFKAYKQSTGKTYILTRLSGKKYIYNFNISGYPSERIDLVYDATGEEDGPGTPGDDSPGPGGDQSPDGSDDPGSSTASTPTGGTSLGTIAGLEEGTVEPGEVVPGTKTEEVALKGKEGALRSSAYGKEKSDYDEPGYERGSSRRKPSRRKPRDRDMKAPSQRPTKAKAPIAYERPKTTKKKVAKTEPEVPKKHGVPLAVKILSLLSIPATVVITAKRLHII